MTCSTSTISLFSILILLISTSSSASIISTSPVPSSSKVRSFPIKRSSNSLSNKRSDLDLPTWATKQRSHLRNKYNFNHGNERRGEGSSSSTLYSYQSDSTYYTNIQIGSAATSYNVIVDTGSADLWLSSSAFNPSTSTTFTNQTTPFSITYGSGSVSGYLGSDSITLAEHTVSSQTFAVATTVASGLTDETLNGILGMGFTSLAASGATPFWLNANLNQEIFGVYLSRDGNNAGIGSGSSQGGPEGGRPGTEIPGKRNGMKKIKRQIVVDHGQDSGNDQGINTATAESSSSQTSSSSISSEGQFTLGGLNTSLYTGDINYSNVISKSYWLINMLDLNVNNQTINLDGTSKTAIDTGTTLIGGPSEAVKALYAAIDGSSELADAEGYYQYPCSTTVDVALTFGNQSYTIPAEDFLASYVDSSLEYCMGAVFDVGSDSSDTLQWIVGDAFLKNVYSVYSNIDGDAKVGFASLADGLDSTTQSKIAQIASGSMKTYGGISATWVLAMALTLGSGLII